MVERLIVLHRDRDQKVDGIRDHSRRLAEELARRRPAVAQVRRRPGRATSPAGILRRLDRLGPGDALIVQYSPFCYGRWGFAPWLPAGLLALRARRRRPTIVLLIHETFLPMSTWRWAVMGGWQRLQLAALRLSVDVTFVSIEPWQRELEGRAPRRPVHHLPVGSNFPDARGRRAAERARLGIGEETLVVACLGRGHHSWLGEYVVAAANAIAATGRPVVLSNLGAGTEPLAGLRPEIEVERPGYLTDDDFAARLAATDLFLAPLADGVSTRRGSMMAAFQHGLPVLGTEGPLTDPVLRAGTVLRLAPVGDPARFAAAAVELAGDPAARAALGAAGRGLYEREFDWPVTAERLLASLPAR